MKNINVTKKILFDFNQHSELSAAICNTLDLILANFEHRLFPDGESYLRCHEDVKNAKVTILCDLHMPNDKLLPLLLFSETLKELGAESVGLIAPYLCYMRQDVSFNPGESVTSVHFAKLISSHFDWLITVDPHLHRYKNLNEIYTIKNAALTSVTCIANYIKQNIDNPVIIGPDGESQQWAAKVAEQVNCPYEVLQKQRHGDRDVSISVPHVENYLGHTPVLVDDIISTGKTMILAAQHLTEAGLPTPFCIAVHAVFSPGAIKLMQEKNLKVMTCNTIAHPSNAIDLSDLICQGIKQLNP